MGNELLLILIMRIDQGSHEKKDLGVPVSAEVWSNGLVSAKNMFTCNRIWESQYRILYKVQHISNFLDKIHSLLSPLFVKCKKEVGSYYHHFWKCSLIFRYWKNVAKELSSIYHKSVTLDPVLGCFFFFKNTPTRQLSSSSGHLILLRKLLNQAKRCILPANSGEAPLNYAMAQRNI